MKEVSEALKKLRQKYDTIYREAERKDAELKQLKVNFYFQSVVLIDELAHNLTFNVKKKYNNIAYFYRKTSKRQKKRRNVCPGIRVVQMQTLRWRS